MDMSDLLKRYPFLASRESELQRAGIYENIHVFKVISYFIKNGDLDALKAFIDTGYDINDSEPGDFGSSLLHIAIRYKQMEIFDYLVEQGADINFTDAVGWTPLMESIMGSAPDFGRKLVDLGADQSIANKRGATARVIATKFDRKDFLEFLR